jgi:high affinity Mn2+ porin
MTFAEAITVTPSNENDFVDWHVQFTHVNQWHDHFTSHGPTTQNSLSSFANQRDTNDLTLFLGIHLWDGGELYINPEIDQGFGFNNTFGVAGFPSGEAYKVGRGEPYVKLPRAFIRQVFSLTDKTVHLDSTLNQMATNQAVDNVTLTIGKFSVVDLFDTNQYAHNPRNDFLNWTIVEGGAFDYAADAWGFSSGVAVEWTQDWWTLRGGLFNLSKVPNGEQLEKTFKQYEMVVEAEERHDWWGEPGKLKALMYVNHGRMGSFKDAIHEAPIGSSPDIKEVRRTGSKAGFLLNFEQSLTPNVGMFARASWNDGSKETFDFTDVNTAYSAGLSVKGSTWNRPEDVVGLGVALNDISKDFRAYLNAGGVSVLVGDGAGSMSHYQTERIVEAYYAYALNTQTTLTGDYQYIQNPAYNANRGPVNVLTFRLHIEI